MLGLGRRGRVIRNLAVVLGSGSMVAVAATLPTSGAATPAAATSAAAAASRPAQTSQTLVAARRSAASVDAAIRQAPKKGLWSRAVNPGTTAVGIAAVMLHTGKVMLLGDPEARVTPITHAFIYDPATGKGHTIAAPAPVFCGGIVQLDDGRLLSVGGARKIPIGITDVFLFDPVTEKWTRQPDTPLGRYYPTLTKLPNGQVLITAGTESDGVTPNPTVEIYTPPPPGKSVGTLKVVGKDHTTGFYPLQWLMPNGKVVQVKGHRAYQFDPANQRWTGLGRLQTSAGPGASGMLMPGGPAGSNRVITFGGIDNGEAISAVNTFNYAKPDAGWSLGNPFPTPRAHVNMVQVPNGSAFAIGGNSSGLFDAPRPMTLRFNPKAGGWSRMAVQSVRRAYHSTAVLLPSGRILSAGDTGDGGGGAKIDVYSPPYLFHGKRPKIAAAPGRVHYGGKFRITGAGRQATQAVLMAPSSTTHAVEMNGRYVPLKIRRAGQRFTAVVPKAAVTPPGYYMLFLVTPGGIPSKAAWVHVGR
jgi:hypothetical protein